VFAVEVELQEAEAGEAARGPVEVEGWVWGPDVVYCDGDGRELAAGERVEVEVSDGHRGGQVDVGDGPGGCDGGVEGLEAA